jgi:hypothetical protein
MQVRTRSQTKVLYNVRLSQVKATEVKATEVKATNQEEEVKEEKVEKVEKVPEPAQVPKVEAPLPESKLPLGIWFVASLKKYNKIAKEIANQMIKYKLADKVHAFRELRFEHLRILSEMYSVVVEYFDEVMEAEPEVFVHYEEILCAHITEATCKFKYYLPKTEEESLTFKTFKDIILEASAVINAPSKKY